MITIWVSSVPYYRYKCVLFFSRCPWWLYPDLSSRTLQTRKRWCFFINDKNNNTGEQNFNANSSSIRWNNKTKSISGDASKEQTCYLYSLSVLLSTTVDLTMCDLARFIRYSHCSLDCNIVVARQINCNASRKMSALGIQRCSKHSYMRNWDVESVNSRWNMEHHTISHKKSTKNNWCNRKEVWISQYMRN